MGVSLETRTAALEYVIEIILANQFGKDRAGECEALGKRLAEHARSAKPNLEPGTGDIVRHDAQVSASAVADEVQRIYTNAAVRIRFHAVR